MEEIYGSPYSMRGVSPLFLTWDELPPWSRPFGWSTLHSQSCAVWPTQTEITTDCTCEVLSDYTADLEFQTHNTLRVYA